VASPATGAPGSAGEPDLLQLDQFFPGVWRTGIAVLRHSWIPLLVLWGSITVGATGVGFSVLDFWHSARFAVLRHQIDRGGTLDDNLVNDALHAMWHRYWWVLLLGYLVVALAGLITLAMAVRLAGASIDGDLDATTAAALRRAGARRAPALLATQLCFVLAQLGLAVACIGPLLGLGVAADAVWLVAFGALAWALLGAILSVRCSLAAQLVVLDEPGSGLQLARSWALTRGRAWMLTGRLFIVGAMVSAASAILGVIPGIASIGGIGSVSRLFVIATTVRLVTFGPMFAVQAAGNTVDHPRDAGARRRDLGAGHRPRCRRSRRGNW
jgi:hypothetical protein